MTTPFSGYRSPGRAGGLARLGRSWPLQPVRVMGCLVGVFATVVAAGLGWLAHFFGASFGTIAIVVAVTLVLVTLP